MADRTYLFVGSQSGGLWRKESGQDHWDDLCANGLPPQPEARVIAIYPQNVDLVYAGTQRGVYLSEDRGEHWRRADLPEGRTVWSIAFRPDNPGVMFLGTNGNEVYRSDDGGKCWEYLSTIVNPDGIEMTFPIRILGLAIESRHPDNMFAAMEVGGVARSFDAGRTWETVNRDLAGQVDLLDLHGVEVGSSESDVAFISNRTGVWCSTDRGDSWANTHIDRVSPIAYSRGVRVAPDDPNTLYACVGRAALGEEGGLMRTTDLGQTWQRFDRGVTPQSTIYGLAINAQHPEQVYFCTRGAQVFGTDDGGSTWREQPLPEAATALMGIACMSA